MPRDSTPPTSASGQDWSTAPADELDSAEWRDAFQHFILGRVAQAQSQAQSWLGVISTLFGLFSAVVVINHGTTVDELHVGIVVQIVVFALAVITYALAFSAVVEGARATWGGLGLGVAAATKDAKAQKWSSRLDQPIKLFKSLWNPPRLSQHLLEDSWGEYRAYQFHLADDLRTRLHRSRMLGVAAVLLAGTLAVVILGLGAFVHPAKEPTSVVVVNDGQVTCGTINVGADGQTRVGPRVVSQATQVVVVAHC